MRFDAANRRVHTFVRQLLHDGASEDDLASILLAYALKIEFEAHGNTSVADHLRRLSEKFATGSGRAFAEIGDPAPPAGEQDRQAPASDTVQRANPAGAKAA